MNRIIRHCSFAALALATTLLSAACEKERKGEGERGESPAGEHGAEHAATGKVIIVEAQSDEKGNYFSPNDIEAHRGDVIRFTLKSGVHNVHFLADSNPGKTGLPAASDMLQMPGQTYDVNVTFSEGRYYFQCDPHAALGMTGHLKVED